MIILSVDLGDSRTGVAVCDKLEMLASPVTVIHERYVPNILSQISRIAETTGAELIVVGHPKNMDGSEGERAEKCAAFARDLSEACGIETVLWDERLTTVSAHYALNETGVFGKKRKSVVDSVAAVMILQSYLDRRRIQNAQNI
ncbi:MAG: Holliday junction resolvase RuvX [Clostridia bacterium]|nr:Holliday junction resolvase RuvX [Clostridia bacterium]